MIDYRRLLAKYMNAIMKEEGITFVSRIYPDDGFTVEEIEELIKIEGETDENLYSSTGNDSDA